jgi:hypothetical protein
MFSEYTQSELYTFFASPILTPPSLLSKLALFLAIFNITNPILLVNAERREGEGKSEIEMERKRVEAGLTALWRGELVCTGNRQKSTEKLKAL